MIAIPAGVQDLTRRRPRALTYLLGALLRGAVGLAYSRRRQHITVQPIRVPPAASATPSSDRGDVECVVVDSLAALAALAPRFPPEFRDSVQRLQRRLAHGCVLSLACVRDGSCVHQVVGYELAERGVFSAMGRKRRVSPDIVFSHWAEVLPAWRGRRIHARLFATRDAYFGARGCGVVVGVVSPKNRASLRALARAGSSVAGTVDRTEVLGGLLAWETPWERIEAVLALRARAEEPDLSRTSEPCARPLRLSSPETPR